RSAHGNPGRPAAAPREISVREDRHNPTWTRLADASPSRRHAMSTQQESFAVYMWGFIESRDGVPEIVEAHGNTVEEFAVLDSTERAIELAFTPAQTRDVRSVFTGSDERGPFD